MAEIEVFAPRNDASLTLRLPDDFNEFWTAGVLATQAARLLGYPRGTFTLANVETRQGLSYLSPAPTEGAWELVDTGGAV